MEHITSVFFGVMLIITGFKFIVWPEAIKQKSMMAFQKRLDQLNAGAEETCFEEKRTLEAYRPNPEDPNWKRRVIGIILICMGVFMISIQFYQ